MRLVACVFVCLSALSQVEAKCLEECRPECSEACVKASRTAQAQVEATKAQAEQSARLKREPDTSKRRGDEAETQILSATDVKAKREEEQRLAKTRAEVTELIERYRRALERLDFDMILDMASRSYYETSGTADDPSDDYDYHGLVKVMGAMKRSVKAIKYTIKIKSVEISEGAAAVDYEYSGEYLLNHDGQDRWYKKSDQNRITLNKNKLGQWRIMSGL